MDSATIELDTSEDYLIYRKGSGGFTMELFEIVVNSERGKGKGRRLVEKLIDLCPKQTTLIYAFARGDNEIARQFYLALGFEKMVEIKSFYPYSSGTTSDAIIFGLHLRK